MFNPDKSYGYGGCDSLQALSEAVSNLYKDEINGLLTYDRAVEKLNAETMLPIAEALQKAVEE